MIWACFVGDKLGPIAFIDGMVNTDVYIAVLNDKLLSFIDELHANGITNVLFQQDNARPHTSKRTKQWLVASAKQHGFSVIEWPANSPELNLIEHLWAHLQLELHRRFPDTIFLRGSPQAIKRLLRQRLMEVRWDIGESILRSLVESMWCRVRTVLDAKGWYTDY